MKYKNILVIQTAFIGDAILASCLLEKLHSEFPESELSILVRKGNESIYQAHPYLKQILIWNKQKNKFRNLMALLRQIRKTKFDCVINCHRYSSSGFLTAFAKAKHTAGFKQNPFSFLFNTTVKHRFETTLHEINRYHELIQDFTSSKIYSPKLYPSQIVYKAIQNYLDKAFICIAPASVWYTKQLPKRKMD